MQNRVALVTGGTGAIGTVICRQLCKAGYRVVAIAHPSEAERLPGWEAERSAEGCDIRALPSDFGDFEAAAAAIKQVEQEVGPVDVLVNGAGITRDATMRKMTAQQWHEVIQTNLDSVFNATRNVFEGMLARGFGRIVNISSINGQRGQFGQANYSAAKAGMHGFTMAVAREGARKGVTVNTISPGYVDSPMIMAVPEEVRQSILAEIPVGRFGRPEDIARTIVFLVADEAGYVNGGHHMG